MDLNIKVSYKDSHDTDFTLTGLPEVEVNSAEYDFLEMSARLACKRLFPRSKDNPLEYTGSIQDAVAKDADIGSNSVEDIFKIAAKAFRGMPRWTELQEEWASLSEDERKKLEADYNAYALKRKYSREDEFTVAFINGLKVVMGL